MAKLVFSSNFLLLSVLLLSPLGLAKEQRKPFRVDIGHFNFPLPDRDIEKKVRDARDNVTAWASLSEKIFDAWWDRYELQLEDVELEEIRKFGNATANVESDNLDEIIRRANITYQEVLVEDYDNNKTRMWNEDDIDMSIAVLFEIEKEDKWLHHRLLSSFAGVGSPVSCSKQIEDILEDMSEWDKAGMAAATTLMALLPTFLAFGNLFVPRSSEAFATSWMIGLGAALFSLGLPVRSLSCIKRKQVLELATLDKDPLDEISELGENNDKNDDGTPKPIPTPKELQEKLEELQMWTDVNHPRKYMEDFARIRRKVDEYQKRWHCWHVPALLVAGCQGAIFGVAVAPLLQAGGIPRFIFACGHVNWTGWYLAISAAVNALFRLVMWQLCDHELVKIYHLSSHAKAKLETFKLPDKETTASHLPPLYPPIISRFHRTTGLLIKQLPGFKASRFKPMRREHPLKSSVRPLRDQMSSLAHIARNPISFLRAGFTPTDQTAAPRWRPLVVLIHLSTNGRPQLKTLFTGFVEAALLLVLTIFFASQWGGNLFITSIALSLLLVFITLGRALAIGYVWLSAKLWGLHSINCDDQNEILGCLRIVCSMKGVLVTVNGAHYYDGYRLDEVEAFGSWRRAYAKGLYDAKPEDDDDTPTKKAGATEITGTNGTWIDGTNTPEKRAVTKVDTTPVGSDMV